MRIFSYTFFTLYFIEKCECVKFNWIYYVSMKSRIAYASVFLYLSIIFCYFFSRIGVVTIFSCSVSFLIVIEIFIILCLHYACNFQIWWQQSWVRFLFLLVSVLLRLLLYSFEHWKVIHHKWVADMENQSHNISKIYINCIESTIN